MMQKWFRQKPIKITVSLLFFGPRPGRNPEWMDENCALDGFAKR
jgi:hypothetical protein